MSRHTGHLPPDAEARVEALDIGRSFIVQAPAGSGKTELLIQRILSLLAVVDQPEEILAITFTRKAAAEMRERLLLALQGASSGPRPDEAHQIQTFNRAKKALQRDVERGWNIVANPSRLQIMTIDSFCSSLVRRMPWLARLGEQPGICEDPDKLYRQAVEQLLVQLEGGGDGSEAIALLLAHLDNRLDRLRDLLVSMLSRRDQWLRHVVDSGPGKRERLEASLQEYIGSTLNEVYAEIGKDLFAEIVDLAHYAAGQLASQDVVSPLSILLSRSGFDPLSPDSLPCWQALCDLVLTAGGDLRKTVNKNNGFGAEKNGDAPARKKQMLELLGTLAEAGLGSAIATIRSLPACRYSESQWALLDALTSLLPHAVYELRSVFRQTASVDFIEVSGAALAGLGSVDAPEELLLRLDQSLSHILIDEFQDTSWIQYELLSRLTSGWLRGDGRTLFLVGDPMQSIYLFREADVGLFLRVRKEGLGDIELHPLFLSANFRSASTLVDWFNVSFSQLFPICEDDLRGAVTYAQASAIRESDVGVPLSTSLFNGRNDVEEAETVLNLVREATAGKTAILVRSRAHLEQIVALLKQNDIHFQAQEVDLLSQRPVINDLLSLTRALLQPCDRIAWLALLRAPWCGLELADLLLLSEHDKNIPVTQSRALEPSQQELFSVLDSDARKRVDRLFSVLHRAETMRGRVALSRLVESSWQLLGGPACVDVQSLEDARQFFALLNELDVGGDLLSVTELTQRLEKLYASSDPRADGSLQVMTIHKSKGLEFDTVILPGLGRGVRPREKALLNWLEHPELNLMLAPIPAADGSDDDTYRTIASILRQREEHEALRLFYVAATRAKKTLHLLGHLNESADGFTPTAGSLLGIIQPVLACEPGDTCHKQQEDSIASPHPTPYIRRLPADWVTPLPAAEPLVSIADVRAASDTESDEAKEGRFSLRNQEGRLIGTLVHQWLERFASAPVSDWERLYSGDGAALLKRQICQLGIPEKRHEACLSKVSECLGIVCRSETAKWILGSHIDEACELELSGLVAGNLVHASIDRTFVADGVRWIIDYKTSIPAAGEDVERFLQRESSRYRAQVETYMDLYNTLDRNLPIKGALYFPMIDLLHELAD